MRLAIRRFSLSTPDVFFDFDLAFDDFFGRCVEAVLRRGDVFFELLLSLSERRFEVFCRPPFLNRSFVVGLLDLGAVADGCVV